jgi:hypothetical protein
MLRDFLAVGRSQYLTDVRERLMNAGKALREKLVWLATPTSDTRRDLERFVCDALLAAATGRLDQL